MHESKAGNIVAAVSADGQVLPATMRKKLSKDQRRLRNLKKQQIADIQAELDREAATCDRELRVLDELDDDDTQPNYADDAVQQPPNEPKGEARWHPRDGGGWFPMGTLDRPPPRQQLKRRDGCSE